MEGIQMVTRRIFPDAPLVGPRATGGCTERRSPNPEAVLDLQFLQPRIHPSRAPKAPSVCTSSNTL